MSFYATFFAHAPLRVGAFDDSKPRSTRSYARSIHQVLLPVAHYIALALSFRTQRILLPRLLPTYPPWSRGTFFRSSLSNCNFCTAGAHETTSNVDKLCRIVRGSSCEVFFAARRHGSDVRSFELNTLF